MVIMRLNLKKIILIVAFSQSFALESAISDEAYFDLSDEKIEIQTNFNGKEIIIFGLTEPELDTIITIKGPKKDTKISKKERFFFFWFDIKKIIYKDLPTVFFIASSSPIKDILNKDDIYKKKLDFEDTVMNLITQRNFIDQNKIKEWNNNLIRIQNYNDMFKKYDLKIVDNRLFQVKVFFPSTTIPGSYVVSIYKIKNKKILSEKEKIILINKTGIGNKIYEFANEQSAVYGIISILFAVIAGLIAASAFRRM